MNIFNLIKREYIIDNILLNELAFFYFITMFDTI